MVVLLYMSTYFAVTPAQSQPYDHDDSYGIILDGGSSGTKLKVYKWNSINSNSFEDNKHSGQNSVTGLHLMRSTKFKPSINAVAFNLDRLDGYLDTILQSAITEIPQKKHPQTPIYFLATAGTV